MEISPNMKDHVALVTGASRGIGRAIAARLARQGYHILINFRSRQDEAAETLRQVEQAGGTGELMPFDVADYPACEQTLGAWLEANPAGIEVLVNNAGMRKDDLLMWVQPEQWKQVMDTNLNSFYNVSRPVVKDMILKRRGRVVTISSTSGQTGLPGQVSYSAAKAGLIGATKALAREVARRGITANVVCPGFIETDIIEGVVKDKVLQNIPLGRLGRPEEVAGLVAFLCTEEAAYITGAEINVNGGVHM